MTGEDGALSDTAAFAQQGHYREGFRFHEGLVA
jgi:hypothetical protein